MKLTAENFIIGKLNPKSGNLLSGVMNNSYAAVLMEEYAELKVMDSKGLLPKSGELLPTETDIRKTLHECAKITMHEGGIEMQRIFETEAKALLKLFTGK